MAGQGSVTIDFGAHPGQNQVTATVSGLTDILATSGAEAYMMADSTADHTASDHAYAAALISFCCTVPTAGDGFTIYATSTEQMTGTYKVRYVYA